MFNIGPTIPQERLESIPIQPETTRIEPTPHLGESYFNKLLGHPANQAKSYGRSVPLDAQYGCSCAMDQDLAQVQVIALAHTEQVRLAFGRVLLRHDAEPCSELPPSAKVVHTAM